MFWRTRGIYVICRTCGRDWLVPDRDLQAYCGVCGASLREEVEDATAWVGDWYWSLRHRENTVGGMIWLAVVVGVLLLVGLRAFLGDVFAFPIAVIVAVLAAAVFLDHAVSRSKPEQGHVDQSPPENEAGRAPPRDFLLRARRRPARHRKQQRPPEE